MGKLQWKRVYDAPEESDGYRILIDRLWPRGIKKEAAELSDWAKDIAPSTDLRKKVPSRRNFLRRFRHRLRQGVIRESGLTGLC